MNHPTAFLCACLLLPAIVAQPSGAPGWVEKLHLTAAVAAASVDNISRTSHEPSRKDAETYELSLASTHVRQLAPNLLLIGTGDAAALNVPDYELNDNVRVSGRLALQRKFGLGPQSPVLQFSAGATYKAARFGADRGWTTEAGLQFSKRVLPNLRLAALTNWLEHNARSATFDLNQHSYGVEAQWDITDRWTLSGSASRLEGDIVANASWPIWGMALGGGFGPAVQQYYTARPWTTTNLYGPRWVSYNVEAEVDLWSVSLGYALSDHTSLEVRKSGAYVVNALGIAYPTDSWSLGLSHRF